MGEAERLRAIEWASSARDARFVLREQLRNGDRTIEAVLGAAQTDPLVGQVKLLWTLESLPGARKVATRRKLAELGLAESTRLEALSADQQREIVATFAASHGV